MTTMSDKTSIESRSIDLLSSVILIVLSILIWWQSSSFPELDEGYPGPNLFPRIIAIGLGIIGVILFITNLRARPIGDLTEPKLESTSWIRPISAIIIIVFFPILSKVVGFILTILIVTVLIGLVFQLKWWEAVITGVTTAGFIYLIFSLLLGVLL